MCFMQGEDSKTGTSSILRLDSINDLVTRSLWRKVRRREDGISYFALIRQDKLGERLKRERSLMKS